MTWGYHCKPLETHLEFTTVDSIAELDIESWNSVPSNNVFLSIPYLKSIEDSKIDRLNFKYCIVYKENNPVGICYFQLLDLAKFEQSNNSIVDKISNHIKNTLLETVNLRLLIGGNVFTTGENCYSFDKSIDDSIIFDNLSNIMFQIRTNESSQKTPGIVLLKEFYPENHTKSNKLTEYDFRPFKVDVNMVMNIDPNWNNIDDYLASMTTKFRTKAKSCFKKSKDVVQKEFSVSDIIENKDRIEALYNNVVDSSEFKLSKFNANTFINLKQNLKDLFLFDGYFLEDVLVGFKTAYLNENQVDAGYVGLDYDFNYNYSIYQKILYGYVDIAILHKKDKVNFGRTAEEIKSTLGAEPVDMLLYLRHRNSLSNKIIKPIVKSITPNEFSIRKPFKKNA